MTKGRFSDLAKDRKKYQSLARRMATCLRNFLSGYHESNATQARELIAELDQELSNQDEVFSR